MSEYDRAFVLSAIREVDKQVAKIRRAHDDKRKQLAFNHNKYAIAECEAIDVAIRELDRIGDFVNRILKEMDR